MLACWCVRVPCICVDAILAHLAAHAKKTAWSENFVFCSFPRCFIFSLFLIFQDFAGMWMTNAISVHCFERSNIKSVELNFEVAIDPLPFQAPSYSPPLSIRLLHSDFYLLHVQSKIQSTEKSTKNSMLFEPAKRSEKFQFHESAVNTNLLSCNRKSRGSIASREHKLFLKRFGGDHKWGELQIFSILQF